MNQAAPFRLFARWFSQARRQKQIVDATALCVSTLDTDGFPDGRMVLLKEFDERGFVFYTNLHSVKGQALQKTPRAALTFHWAPLGKQVRIQGKTEIVSQAEADAYWVSRPRLSQLGAWASHQSEVLSSRSLLIREVQRLARVYKGKPIPRPAHWTGIRVIPRQIEFWKAYANRLHDRFLYKRQGASWRLQRLYP